MFSFLAGFRTKIIAFIVGLSIISVIFFYIKYLQSENEVLRINQIKLERAIEDQKRTIDTLQEHMKKVMRLTGDLKKDLDNARDEQRNIIDILNKHDLTRLSEKKPGLIEKRINEGTRKVFENLERITTP